MRIERLNSTGSFTRIDGDYFSYDTRLSFLYKGEYFVNRTRYTNTTSKHQSNLPHADFNHTLYYQGYGCVKENICIQREIEALKCELECRYKKFKTENNLEWINKISSKIQYLSKLLED